MEIREGVVVPKGRWFEGDLRPRAGNGLCSYFTRMFKSYRRFFFLLQSYRRFVKTEEDSCVIHFFSSHQIFDTRLFVSCTLIRQIQRNLYF